MQLSAMQINRLSLVKYLMDRAKEQCSLAQPLCALALLPMHDAVEMFLDLLAESMDVPISKSRAFIDYWDVLAGLTPPQNLPMRKVMNKLNLARVALKHHGSRLSQDQIHEHFSNCDKFLELACQAAFALTFSDVTMIDLISSDKARSHLQAAQQALSSGDFQTSYGEITIAFYDALTKVIEGPEFHFWSNSHSFTDPTYYGSREERVSKNIEELQNSLKQLANFSTRSAALTSLGFSLKEFARFRRLTPHITYIIGGTPNLQWTKGVSEDKSDCRWCFEITTKLILKIEYDEQRW